MIELAIAAFAIALAAALLIMPPAHQPDDDDAQAEALRNGRNG